MRVLRMAAMIVLLAGPAYAQSEVPHVNILSDTTPPKTPDEIEQEQARDKAYKESLKKIPEAKTSSDPWGSVRGADAGKVPPKTTTAKTKTKSGSNPN